jgi:hypothetical protein
MVIRVLLAAFAGEGTFTKGTVLGFVGDEFVFVAAGNAG